MKKVFLVSHNEYAHGLKKAVEMIAGKQELLFSFGLFPGGHPDEIASEIESMIGTEDHAIILGDIAGGSVCNSVLRLTTKENVDLICGVNLPLALEIILSEVDTDEKFEEIIGRSQNGLKRLELEIQSESTSEDFFK